MTINPSIPLAIRTPDIPGTFGNALLQGQAFKERKETAPLRNKLLEQRAEIQETAISQADTNRQAQGAVYAYEAIEVLKTIPDMEQRKRAHSAFEGQMRAMGYPVTGGEDDLSDEGLAQAQAAVAPFYRQAKLGGRSGRVVGSPARVRGPDNKEYFQVIKDDGAGGISTELIPVEGDFLSTMGETASEESARVVGEAGGKQSARNVADLETKPPVAREVAKSTAIGKAEGDAVASLPDVISNGEYMISTLEKAMNHPGLEVATGLSSKTDPRNFTPGTNAFDFNVIRDQIQGQTFLQAYQSLKGGGQITEVEGKKAEQAIARMNTAQSKESWVEAANEFIGVIRGGVSRAKAKSGQQDAQRRQSVEALTGDSSAYDFMTPEERALFDEPND